MNGKMPTTNINAAIVCTPSLMGYGTWPKSSIRLTPAINAPAPTRASVCEREMPKPWLIAAVSQTARLITTIANPPPRGIGDEWELCSLGTSTRPSGPAKRHICPTRIHDRVVVSANSPAKSTISCMAVNP